MFCIIHTIKSILAVFLAVTTHSICLKRNVNYDIDTMRPSRYNSSQHATQHHTTPRLRIISMYAFDLGKYRPSNNINWYTVIEVFDIKAFSKERMLYFYSPITEEQKCLDSTNEVTFCHNKKSYSVHIGDVVNYILNPSDKKVFLQPTDGKRKKSFTRKEIVAHFNLIDWFLAAKPVSDTEKLERAWFM